MMFGSYPSSLTASRTRSRVPLLIFADPFNTRDTVDLEARAFSATSPRVGVLSIPNATVFTILPNKSILVKYFFMSERHATVSRNTPDRSLSIENAPLICAVHMPPMPFGRMGLFSQAWRNGSPRSIGGVTEKTARGIPLLARARRNLTVIRSILVKTLRIEQTVGPDRAKNPPSIGEKRREYAKPCR